MSLSQGNLSVAVSKKPYKDKNSNIPTANDDNSNRNDTSEHPYYQPDKRLNSNSYMPNIGITMSIHRKPAM